MTNPTPRPWASREEQLTTIAFEAAHSMTPTQIRSIRPVVRTGPTNVRGNPSPTLQDVFAMSRMPTGNRSWISGAPNLIVRAQQTDDQYSSGPRNNLGTGGM